MAEESEERKLKSVKKVSKYRNENIEGIFNEASLWRSAIYKGTAYSCFKSSKKRYPNLGEPTVAHGVSDQSA